MGMDGLGSVMREPYEVRVFGWNYFGGAADGAKESELEDQEELRINRIMQMGEERERIGRGYFPWLHGVKPIRLCIIITSSWEWVRKYGIMRDVRWAI